VHIAGFAPPEGGAFNNCRGSWYEMMVEVDAWNYLHHIHPHFMCLSIPNKAQFELSSLFDGETQALLSSLRSALDSDDVSLVSANPDLLIVRDFQLPPSLDRQITLADMYGTASFSAQFLSALSGLLPWDKLHAAVSVKLSLRPDRTLQILHEANALKAMFEHLRTRQWNRHVNLACYLACPEISNASRATLRTVATHSILNVANRPEAAVDKCFVVDSKDDLHNALLDIVSS